MPSFVFPLVESATDRVLPVMVSARPGVDRGSVARDQRLQLARARSCASGITRNHTSLCWSFEPDAPFSEESHLLAACLAAAAADWKKRVLPLYARSPIWATGALDVDGSLRQDIELQRKLAAFETDPTAQVFLVPRDSERQARHSATTLGVDEFRTRAAERDFWTRHPKVVVVVGAAELDTVLRVVLGQTNDADHGQRSHWSARRLALAVMPAVALVLGIGYLARFRLGSDRAAVQVSWSAPSCLAALRELRLDAPESLLAARAAARDIPDTTARRACYHSQLTGTSRELPNTIFGVVGLLEMGGISDVEKREMAVALIEAITDAIRDGGTDASLSTVTISYFSHPGQSFTEAIHADRMPDGVGASTWNAIRKLGLIDRWVSRLPPPAELEPAEAAPAASKETHDIALYVNAWQHLGACATYPKAFTGHHDRPGARTAHAIQVWAGIYFGGRFAYWNRKDSPHCNAAIIPYYVPCLLDDMLARAVDASAAPEWVQHSGRRHLLECSPGDRCVPVFVGLGAGELPVEGMCISSRAR